MFTTELRNYGLGGLLGARTAEGVPERTYVTNESRKWSDDPQLMRGEQPVASTNSVSTYITLAEPVLFLQGWPSSYPISGSAVLLRGVVKIDVAKTTKIRSITLNFKGTSTTKWPEGIVTETLLPQMTR